MIVCIIFEKYFGHVLTFEVVCQERTTMYLKRITKSTSELVQFLDPGLSYPVQVVISCEIVNLFLIYFHMPVIGVITNVNVVY